MTAKDMLLEQGWNFLENGWYQPDTAFPMWEMPPHVAATQNPCSSVKTVSKEKLLLENVAPEKPRVMRLINIAGTQYHCGPGFFRGLREGVPVRLAREAANPHDPNAVAVFIGPRKVGYIPRHSNRAIATWMDRGAGVEAEVSAVRLHADPWNRVFVRVTVQPAA